MTSVKFPRRKFLHLTAGAAALSAVLHTARAQTYPSRPIRFIAPFPAGGSVDLTARIIGQWLSERLGQQVIVENRAGAGGNVGTEAVVNAPPDGHTLLLATTANAISVSLYEKLNFDFMRDLTPVAGIIRLPNVMVVNPRVPARTVPEFIAYAKANPGSLNMASSGNGTSVHVSGELFKLMAGVNFVHVPYRGEAPAVTDLLGGQVQVMFPNIPALVQHIRSGAVRALGVTSTTRSDILPEIPSLADFVPGYEASAFYGVCAPSRTSGNIVAKLNDEINLALVDPKIRARLADLGASQFPVSPADFAKHLASEIEKWGKIVRAANLKAE